VVGATTAEVRRARVAAGVRRHPAVEPVSGQIFRRRVVPTARPLAEVPLAAVLHLVACCAQHRRKVREVATEFRLRARDRAVRGQRVDHPVLRRHQSRQERRPARTAHRRVAHRVVEAHPVAKQPRARLQPLLGEPLGPVHRRPLLVRDDQNQVRIDRQLRHANHLPGAGSHARVWPSILQSSSRAHVASREPRGALSGTLPGVSAPPVQFERATSPAALVDYALQPTRHRAVSYLLTVPSLAFAGAS
jgi:hypothetical protein